ncbi:MAG: glycyl-radical enzyme activating protein [Bacillota bacterium]|nr:glycyl-radical enzyme activating protein [Bacillota bacterium]
MTNLSAVEGMIFNVQHYCIHDGPGIRTTVFMKGCPLRCLWCQNPESHSMCHQIFFTAEKCAGCGKCIPACPIGAIHIQDGKAVTNRNLCQSCGVCTTVCLHEARNMMGTRVSAGEVFNKIEQDKIFYEESGGGATLSGGEPLFQSEFAASVLSLCKKAGIHTALETSGYARWDILQLVLPYVDLLLFDLKHMDPSEHQKCTGVSNELIKDNVIRIYHQQKKPVIIRIPVIPGYNDSLENIEATAEFVACKLGASVPVNLLPFHRLGESKNERMGVQGLLFNSIPPSEQHLKELKEIFVSHGLTVQIGG